MLTFRQLDDLPDVIVKTISQAEQDIINDMARRIAKGGSITDATQWQLYRLEAIGAGHDYIIARLSEALNVAEKQLIDLFDEAATRTISTDDQIYRAAGYSPIPLAENAYLQQIIRAGLVKTLDEYQNLTKTTANTATRQFERVLDRAYHQFTFGGFSYQQAIKDGIKDLTRNGIEAITYPTNHTDYLDAAFRRATLTGVNQTAAEVQLANIEQMGTDLVETTAHHGARPDHAVWQGKIFSIRGTSDKYPSFYQETGYGTGPGLCGWNCRHSFFPYFEGLSDPAYSYDKLREYNSKTVTYNGKNMSLYDATQHQRYIERRIRRWKREDNAMGIAADAAPNAVEKLSLTNAAWVAYDKVLYWQEIQRGFIKQTGLKRDYFRERAGAQYSA